MRQGATDNLLGAGRAATRAIPMAAFAGGPHVGMVHQLRPRAHVADTLHATLLDQALRAPLPEYESERYRGFCHSACELLASSRAPLPHGEVVGAVRTLRHI